MRYYFHVILRGQAILDPEGSEIETAAEAQTEARAIARELENEFPDRMGVYSLLEVVTEQGARVFALPLKAPAHCAVP